MHDSRIIANRFLRLARENGHTLTPMQVLKLVYIAHGWMLGLYRRALIRDSVEAWQYGPVIPKLYNEVRDYRGRAVTDFVSEPQNAVPLSPEEDDIVSQVYELYGAKTGAQLSALTHADGSPWSNVYKRGAFSLEIPDDLIEAYYHGLAGNAPEQLEAVA